MQFGLFGSKLCRQVVKSFAGAFDILPDLKTTKDLVLIFFLQCKSLF